MNGQTISWDESKPANTDNVAQGDDQIRSDKTALRVALNDEHNFPSTGGANTGYHRLGSARIFKTTSYSQVSSTGTEGRLLYGPSSNGYYNLWYLSETTIRPIGGSHALCGDSYDGLLQSEHVSPRIEVGTVTTGSLGTAIVTFEQSGFSGKPFTTATPVGSGGLYVSIYRISKGSVEFECRDGSNVLAPSIPIYYMSVGSRSFTLA